MDTTECKERAAECRRMAELVSTPSAKAMLTDIAWTWERLAIEAEISGSLRVLSELSTYVSRKPLDRN